LIDLVCPDQPFHADLYRILVERQRSTPARSSTHLGMGGPGSISKP
jgi:hypothetical protein